MVYSEIMNDLQSLTALLQKKGDSDHALIQSSFFKTGIGEYGEGDIFIGIRVPDLRAIAKAYQQMKLEDVLTLLQDSIHEYRLTALLILTYQYEKASKDYQKEIYTAYIQSTQWINNWDLVDTSAYKIVGPYLRDRSRKQLFVFAESRSLWERRIAIIATFAYIRKNDFVDTIKIAEILLEDREDLIQKAVGWMLREIGKRDEAVLKNFLDIHASRMPRTMLRYAIERLSQKEKKRYMTAG